MAQPGSDSIAIDSLTPVHWLALGLVVATGLIHVYAGLVEGRIPVSLAGIGFLGAVVLFLVNYRRALLYPVGIVFTAVQFPLWYVGKAGEYTMLGYADKAIQALLILVLAYLIWQDRRRPERDRDVTTA
jgi:hypothetical protein